MRIASVPQGHVYVQHLSDPMGQDGVIRLPDPRPERPAAGAPWWPAVMLDPQWIAQNADDFDVYHLHFGFDAIGAKDLSAIVEALRERGKPFVYTVHDLRNPHHHDAEAHDAALDVLVPAADALITLTPGAAKEIKRRWGRAATVIPHPHVVDVATLHRVRPRRRHPRVGIHLKSLRANLDPLPMLDLLLAESEKQQFHLVVDVHCDVMTPGSRNHNSHVVELLRQAQSRPQVSLQVHDFYSDAQLWNYFLSLDLSVLPYRFGTHSGWLEACYDLGTKVLAPRIGFYHEQQSGVLGYRLQDGRPWAADVRAALDQIQDAGEWRVRPAARRVQRQAIAQAHRRLYDQVCAAHRVAKRGVA